MVPMPLMTPRNWLLLVTVALALAGAWVTADSATLALDIAGPAR